MADRLHFQDRSRNQFLGTALNFFVYDTLKIPHFSVVSDCFLMGIVKKPRLTLPY